MSEELRPCPFCGGEAKVCVYEAYMEYPECYAVGCGATIEEMEYDHVARTEVFETKEEAINAWNTRHERTCKPVDTYIHIFECSVCGTLDTDGTPSYCPNCGAKVIDEKEER